MPVRRRRVRQLVEELLLANKVKKPPVAVESIARSNDLEIRLQPLDSNLSGFLYRHGSRTLIGANSRQARVRQRFTIAHELGHYFLHEPEPLHFDRASYFRLRSDLASQGIDAGEIEANLFAAELLMPQLMVEKDMRSATGLEVLDDDFLATLARRYGVSAQAMILRLTNLGYVEQ